MKINVNGTIRETSDNLTITGLLEALGYGEDRATVERNGKTVARAQHAEITVNDGDQVWIIEDD